MMEYLKGCQERLMESFHLFFTLEGWQEMPDRMIYAVSHTWEIIGGLF
ncbi:hypothetical protein M3611_26720 [Priestia megaterium]|nr:hypothetical protein [Priestia megaterium]MCM3155589.1 hypothetical protein [Priestia megaterium]